MTVDELPKTPSTAFVNDIKADLFSVTDGGQESTEIFKSYNFQMYESFETSNCDNSISVVETIDVNGNIFFESAQLIGINSTKDSMSINSGCLLEAIQKTEILGTGGSKTVDFGIGLLSKLGMEFISNGQTIVDPIPQNYSFIDSVKSTKKITQAMKMVAASKSVSYTHLTLPTSDLV